MKSQVQLFAVRVSLLVAVLAIGGASVTEGQTLPSPWIAQDVGNPLPAGRTSFNQGSFTVTASGARIGGTSDQFHFIHQQVSGDVEVLARVDSIFHADPFSSAGVMIRDSMAANAREASVLVSAGRGLLFQRRTTTGGSSDRTYGEAAAAPRWVRLARKGSSITAYSSVSGATWTTIATATIPIGTTAYVGLAVASQIAGGATTAVMSQVAVLPLSLPPPQQARDIGMPAIAGGVSFRQGVYTVFAGGSDIWGTSDQFHFVYQPVAGDVEVVARVAWIFQSNAWAKAGVMIRESLAANSRNASALMTPSSGLAFQRRIDTGGLSEHTGASGAPPGWMRLLRRGSRIEAFRSANGTSWTSIGWDTVPMSESVYVGIAVTSHNASQATAALIDGLRITPLSAPPNVPPTATLTTPANGASFVAPAAITVAASASDPENRLARVEFFSGATRIGTDTAAPYSMTWPSVPAGTHSLAATAFDADGGSATSPAVTIHVTAAPPPAPQVPRWVVFRSSSHHSTVTRYVLEIFAGGANPVTAAPLVASDLGKPAPAAGGDITIDRLAVFTALAPGSYVATVSAIGPGGEGQSAPATFVR